MTNPSNVVDIHSPTANMYGCEPCPKCKGIYRCVFDDKPGVIQCDECGFHEDAELGRDALQWPRFNLRDCKKHNEILKQSELRLLKEVRDLTGERERERQALGNLLAVIHRDGGHYQAEHGSKKAAEDAETLVCWLRDNVERLESQVRELTMLRKGLREFGQHLPTCKVPRQARIKYVIQATGLPERKFLPCNCGFAALLEEKS